MSSFPSTQLNTYIQNAMQAFQTPAFSLAVVQDDQVIFAQGYGAADEHTTFAIASISKSFTATALAMLFDEGRVQWDGLVTDYLPGFQLMDRTASQEMRVRDLLIHNSGLPEVSGGTIWYGSDLDRAEVVRRLRYLRSEASFRGKYAYQNVMYLAAGEAVRAVSGQSWDQFMMERIFAPLGMRDSAPNYALGMQNPNRAAPHARVPYGSTGEVREIPYRDHDNCGPAASIHASAWDLAQYLRFHLNGGEFEGMHLLMPGTMNLLHSPQIALPREYYPTALQPAAPRIPTYGLGWRVQDYRGQLMVQHSGGVDGMRTLVTMLPEQRIGVVALSNNEVPLTYVVTQRVMDLLLGLVEVDWAGAYAQLSQSRLNDIKMFEQQRLNDRQSGTKPSLPLEAYAGRYPSPLVDAVDVALEDGRLVLRFAHTPAFTADMSHWHYDTFRLDWRDEYVPWGLVTFPLNALGRVHGLRLDQPNLLDVDFGELGYLKREDMLTQPRANSGA